MCQYRTEEGTGRVGRKGDRKERFQWKREREREGRKEKTHLHFGKGNIIPPLLFFLLPHTALKSLLRPLERAAGWWELSRKKSNWGVGFLPLFLDRCGV